MIVSAVSFTFFHSQIRRGEHHHWTVCSLGQTCQHNNGNRKIASLSLHTKHSTHMCKMPWYGIKSPGCQPQACQDFTVSCASYLWYSASAQPILWQNSIVTIFVRPRWPLFSLSSQPLESRTATSCQGCLNYIPWRLEGFLELKWPATKPPLMHAQWWSSWRLRSPVW